MLRLLVALGVVAASYVGAENHWTVTNSDTNETCIVLDTESVGITVKFTSNNGTVETYNAVLNSSLSVTGECVHSYGNRAAQTLKVSFYPDGSESSKTRAWDLEFIFGSEKKNAFQLLDYRLVTSNIPEVNASFPYNFTKAGPQVEFQARNTNAFRCSTTELALVNDSIIEMKDVRVIAFAQLESPYFPKQQIYEQCPLDSRTSDIVPIVVGACLAGLVVIVLVAYLIGRARAKRQGYASV